MALSSEIKTTILSLIKKVMQENCPPLVMKKNSNDATEVIGNVAVAYGSKKKMVDGMYFASVLVRDTNVSFYFFACYTHPGQFSDIAPTLLKYLDGKSCFHFKKTEQVPEKELKALFKKGISFYKKQGWIK